MKHFKYLLFLSFLCPLLVFTNCGEDSEDEFLLNRLNGYYSLEVYENYETYLFTNILEFKDGDVFWSTLTDSCLHNNMKDLTSDTIISHTPSYYVGIYKISSAEYSYLRLSITDAKNGVGVLIEPGLIASRTEFCFSSFLSNTYNLGGDCLVPHQEFGLGEKFPRTNTQSEIDDFIQTPECD